MAQLSKDQVVDIVKRAPKGVTPESVVDELVKQGHVLEGYAPAAATSPSFDEKPLWEAGKAAGEGYHATQAKVVAARNKFTQAQPQASLPQLARGVGETTSAMAFAAPQIVKGGVQAGAAALKAAAPGSKVAAGTAAAVDFAANVIPTGPGELAAQAVGERYAGPVLKAVGKAVNPVAKKALSFMAQKFGGLAEETTKLLEARAPDVVKYARQGVDAATEAAAAAAKTVKERIEQYVDKAGQEYGQAIDNLVTTNPQYNNLRVDLPRLAGKTIEKVRQDFGFADQSARLPNLQLVGPGGQAVQAAQGAVQRVGKAAGDVDLFNEFAAQFQRPMTPTQAYLLQKDLSYAIRANAGKPISAALGKLKTAAVSAFDATLQGSPLETVNKGYRAAMTIADDLSKVSNADNAVTVINSAFKNRGETRDALATIAKVSPGVQQALDDMFAATAGKQVAHWTAQLPPTGAKALYQLGLGASGAAVMTNPIVGIPSAGAYMAATSPRMYGEGFNLLSKNLPNLPRGSTTATIAALRARRKDDK